MVHQALEEMVVERAGPQAWSEICAEVGSPTTTFPSLSSFPDELTVGLVVAAAELLDEEVDGLLVQFGRVWVEFALTTAYGPLLREASVTFVDTLRSLDGLHARVAIALPELRPPSFRVIGEPPTITLEYYSPRDGLAQFVVGLLEGLAEMHGIEVGIVHRRAKEDGFDHDEFGITLPA